MQIAKDFEFATLEEIRDKFAIVVSAIFVVYLFYIDRSFSRATMIDRESSLQIKLT